ncbi:MAG TPA: TIGR00730 family Rossman fold protein [Elusimicrobiota bacterium]|nr:TIGR00730 family Rossman fold protein [Elusimicrobiota bacterium]HNA59852.1 TIGR00730 family Rossman fold protein [Elusimicrobiota bacterium]HNC74348.1 TIGR00730 family Rossman fold protein [Elusimicrobiota bacterium]
MNPIDPHSHNEIRPAEEIRTESFNAWDPAITQQIDALVAKAAEAARSDGDPDTTDLAREIIVTALKTQQAHLSRGDVKILSRAIRELRYGFRVFRPYRDRRKVTIFGSARTRPADIDYKQARAFARKMVKKGFMVITGAGPGIMQAGNHGAGAENSFGINIKLPFEQSANEFVDKGERFIDCRFFFTRKLMFIKETSAVALFPGGFGTHDEGMEVLTLVQTGKCDPMPIVFIETPGGSYWSDWEKYVRKHLLGKKKISEEDLSLFKVTDSVSEAAEEIATFYRNYHSLRYVKDRMVIRLQKAPAEMPLKMLNRDFKDIVLPGASMTISKALPEESEWPDLPRLVFPFNRINYGRLRQLINALNAL